MNQALNPHALTYFPRQRVMLAHWNEVRINSRWYHWEKMEHNVENAPCLAATGPHNQEREPILGMRYNREDKRMPYNIQYTVLAQHWALVSYRHVI